MTFDSGTLELSATMAFLQLQSAAYDEFFGWQQYVNLPLRHAEVQLSS